MCYFITPNRVAVAGGVMQHFSVPTCYFPTTALFLDDSQDFLLNFVLQLEEGFAFKIFDNPYKALDYIHNKRCELELISKHCLSEYTEAKHCPLTNHTINLDLAAIQSEVFNPQRFSEISVVIVDYAMPGMNGLEFCRLIENRHIKKILLTGQADEKLAIEAFNEGLIDRYIKKSDPNIADLIIKSIGDLQVQYFQAMSEMIIKMLSVTSPSCLQDKKFAYFFHQFCQDKKIIEYYLIDNSGSFLMLDVNGENSFFIVKNEADIRLHYDWALDNGADADILDQLASGEKIPCFGSTNAFALEWTEWLNCLVPALKYIGNETYYYAYVSGNSEFFAPKKKILPYSHYLKELDDQEILFNVVAE